MWVAAAIASLFPICCLLYYFGEKRDEKERDRKHKEKYETDEWYRFYTDVGMFDKTISKRKILENINENKNRPES